jgi:hypothetical protein
MLQGVLISLGSTAASPVHSANNLPTGAPGTVARSASIWRGISTLGAYPRAWGLIL